MTNTEALDIMLKLFTTAEFAKKSVELGRMPTQEEFQQFLRGVSRTAELMITKMMVDDNVAEWEIQERIEALFEEVSDIVNTKRS